MWPYLGQFTYNNRDGHRNGDVMGCAFSEDGQEQAGMGGVGITTPTVVLLLQTTG
jgi:hypothetical protein